MENKTKKTKVDYAAIIREYEMAARIQRWTMPSCFLSSKAVT